VTPPEGGGGGGGAGVGSGVGFGFGLGFGFGAGFWPTPGAYAPSFFSPFSSSSSGS
jgi:hypothetical protein